MVKRPRKFTPRAAIAKAAARAPRVDARRFRADVDEQLRKDIEEGLASGATTALNAADIKRRGRDRLAKRR